MMHLQHDLAHGYNEESGEEENDDDNLPELVTDAADDAESKPLQATDPNTNKLSARHYGSITAPAFPGAGQLDQWISHLERQLRIATPLC